MPTACASLASCTAKFFPSYPAFIRGLTFTGAFMIVFGALFAFGYTVDFMAKLSECDNDSCEKMKLTYLETSLGSFAIHFFLLFISALVVCAELHLSCVVWYFGFVAFRFGRGLSLLICGFVTFSYSRAFITTLEESGHAPADFSLFETCAGLAAALIGVINVVISVLPECCTRWHLPADKLAIEMSEMHEAVRHCRANEAIKASKAKMTSTNADPELGQSSWRAKSGRKSMDLPPPTKLPAPSGIAAQPTTVVVENPFVKAQPSEPEENPFYSQNNKINDGRI